MQLTRIYFGIGLAAFSGFLLCHAWDEHNQPQSWAAALALLSLALIVCAACYARSAAKQAPPARPELASPEPEEARRPLLGDLLVHKYRVITSETLARALAIQRGTDRMLGEVLLNMGVVSADDLLTALTDQRSCQEGWQDEPWAAAIRQREAACPTAAAPAGMA